ncbi:MAG: RNA polymerase sigma factor [Chloroflexi bacterium]|nr:RNA polymerase sigma factor [Chloroflexota bacterium]
MRLAEVIVAEQPPATVEDDFEAIFERYQHPIYNYILRVMGSAEDAFDLTQDTFLKAYVALPRLPADSKIGPWLYRIATNACIDELRRRRLIQWQPWENFVAFFHPKQVIHETPEGEALRKESAVLVQEALRHLPANYRLGLVLREYQEFSCDEIADVLGTTRGAVKSLLFRAREEFRRVYTQLESGTAVVERRARPERKPR